MNYPKMKSFKAALIYQIEKFQISCASFYSSELHTAFRTLHFCGFEQLLLTWCVPKSTKHVRKVKNQKAEAYNDTNSQVFSALVMEHGNIWCLKMQGCVHV